ncbi:MAG: hypothetical protein AB8B80_07010, partial [Marinicellaceae bacterium]
MKPNIKTNPFKNSNWLIVFSCILLSSCSIKKPQEKSFAVLAINDVYRTEGLNNGKIGGLARVKTLRNQLIAEGKEV